MEKKEETNERLVEAVGRLQGIIEADLLPDVLDLTKEQPEKVKVRLVRFSKHGPIYEAVESATGAIMQLIIVPKKLAKKEPIKILAKASE